MTQWCNTAVLVQIQYTGNMLKNYRTYMVLRFTSKNWLRKKIFLKTAPIIDLIFMKLPCKGNQRNSQKLF